MEMMTSQLWFLLLLLLLLSLLFTAEKGFSKSYLHITTAIDYLQQLKTIKRVKSTPYVIA